MDNKVTAAFLRMFAATILILLSFSAYAQNSYTVKLKLIDSKTSEPVSFATASLTVKGETTAAKYVLTDAQGAASLTKVKKGTYLFKALKYPVVEENLGDRRELVMQDRVQQELHSGQEAE